MTSRLLLGAVVVMVWPWVPRPAFADTAVPGESARRAWLVPWPAKLPCAEGELFITAGQEADVEWSGNGVDFTLGLINPHHPHMQPQAQEYANAALTSVRPDRLAIRASSGGRAPAPESVNVLVRCPGRPQVDEFGWECAASRRCAPFVRLRLDLPVPVGGSFLGASGWDPEADLSSRLIGLFQLRPAQAAAHRNEVIALTRDLAREMAEVIRAACAGYCSSDTDRAAEVARHLAGDSQLRAGAFRRPDEDVFESGWTATATAGQHALRVSCGPPSQRFGPPVLVARCVGELLEAGRPIATYRPLRSAKPETSHQVIEVPQGRIEIRAVGNRPFAQVLLEGAALRTR